FGDCGMIAAKGAGATARGGVLCVAVGLRPLGRACAVAPCCPDHQVQNAYPAAAISISTIKVNTGARDRFAGGVGFDIWRLRCVCVALNVRDATCCVRRGGAGTGLCAGAGGGGGEAGRGVSICASSYPHCGSFAASVAATAAGAPGSATGGSSSDGTPRSRSSVSAAVISSFARLAHASSPSVTASVANANSSFT